MMWTLPPGNWWGISCLGNLAKKIVIKRWQEEVWNVVALELSLHGGLTHNITSTLTFFFWEGEQEEDEINFVYFKMEKCKEF